MARVRAEVFARTDGTWAWRAIAANNQIVGSDAGQGYVDRAEAEAMMRRVLGGEYAVAVGRQVIPVPDLEQLTAVLEQGLADALAGPRPEPDLNMVARYLAAKVRELIRVENEDSSRQG